jgi:hypothetical protein
VLVDVARKNVEARTLTRGNCTFTKAPFSVVEKTREEDLLIKVAD